MSYCDVCESVVPHRAVAQLDFYLGAAHVAKLVQVVVSDCLMVLAPDTACADIQETNPECVQCYVNFLHGVIHICSLTRRIVESVISSGCGTGS